MVEKVSVYILDNLLYKGVTVKGDEREIMLFGITRMIEDLPKYLFVFIVSLFLHILPQVGMVLLTTIIYKSFIGGAHARTNIQCFVYTSLFFFLPVIIARFVNIPNYLICILGVSIFLYSLYVIYKHAPADTEEIPILKKEKRNKMKIQALVALVCLYIITIFLKNNLEFIKIIYMTVFFIDLFTSKVFYKFLKCKHSYESDEFKEYFENKE